MARLLHEPFRVFFPWALVAGCVGVALWPLFLTQWLPFYPGLAHARLMTEGLLGAFALGFLSTAAPRMIESPPLARGLVVFYLLLHVAVVGLHASGRVAWGDGLFAGLWALWLAVMVWKWAVQRQDSPPAGAVAVLGGVLCGVAGAGAMAAGADLSGTWMAYRLPRLLLYEGFLLLPLLGVGSFLFSRITGLAARAGGGKLAVMSAATLAVVATFFLEAGGWPRTGLLLRAAVVLAVLGWCIPGLWWRRVRGTQAWALRLGLWSVVLASPLQAAWPERLVALGHVLFTSGFGLVTLAVAARVTDGHSGHREAAHGRSAWLRWITWLVLLTMATRVSADIWPQVQRSHYIYAALLWIVISALWLAAWGRKLTMRDPDDTDAGKPTPPSS